MGCLNFDLYECELNETDSENRKGFCLKVKGLALKQWNFRAVSLTENSIITDWVSHIRLHLDKARGKDKPIPRVK